MKQLVYNITLTETIEMEKTRKEKHNFYYTETTVDLLE